jgi:D-beta-D-heptose 7-phosphate kinase/D-beta-D-heptose 1-phosphate adenosyltransferase
LVPQVDAVIISDYGKGMVIEETTRLIIDLCRKLKKPVTVDPKGKDYSKYRWATVVTPNLKEASLAANIEIKTEADVIKTGKSLLKSVRAGNILITRGRDGMSLFNTRGIVNIPVVSREVFDITGAGDTAIATLTLALAAGAEVKMAADLANHAASIVVSKIGTAPCWLEELEADLAGHEPMINKIKPRQQIGAIVKNLKNEGAKIVFTNGCFDILHLGHARYLREAKKLGDILIVGLNSDPSVRALKGAPRPYVPELERAEILASLESVDYVVIFSEARPDNLIRAIQPDIHVKGGDYDICQLPERKVVEALGGKVVVIPPIEGRSTTNLVDKILGKK